jgi:hypothetical protein
MSKVPVRIKFTFKCSNQLFKNDNLPFDGVLKNAKPRLLLLPVEPNLPIPSPVKLTTSDPQAIIIPPPLP